MGAWERPSVHAWERESLIAWVRGCVGAWERGSVGAWARGRVCVCVCVISSTFLIVDTRFIRISRRLGFVSPASGLDI